MQSVGGGRESGIAQADGTKKGVGPHAISAETQHAQVFVTEMIADRWRRIHCAPPNPHTTRFDPHLGPNNGKGGEHGG